MLKLKRPSNVPPKPAMPAEKAKIMILVRLTRTPDASAATSELRDRERRPARRRAHERVDEQGDEAEEREEQQDLLRQLAEVDVPLVGSSRLHDDVVHQPVEAGDVERGCPDRPAEVAPVAARTSIPKTMLEHKNAAASVPSANITPPSRVASSAMSAPSAAPTIAPNSAAQRKLIWPLATR